MWQHGQEREWIRVFVGLSPIHYPPKTVAVLLIFCLVQFSCSLVSVSLRPLDWSTSGSSVHHQQCTSAIPEIAQTHIHQVESVRSSNHLILCHPLHLLASIFPSIRVFSNESVLHIRWPMYWSFSFSISPSKECSGLISFRIDWFDLLEV